MSMSERDELRKKVFMKIAIDVSVLNTCLKNGVGAVLVKDKRIIATGYNGAPAGVSHCTHCLRQEGKMTRGMGSDLCRANHSELNAILNAAKFGVRTDGADLYVTIFPCTACAKALKNAGIKKIYFMEGTIAIITKKMLVEAGITWEKVKMDE